jgi:hypothetical protein
MRDDAFFKANSGNFATINDRVLAKFPNNNPVRAWDPYIGDYFTLRAVNCHNRHYVRERDFPLGLHYSRDREQFSQHRHRQHWLAVGGSLASRQLLPTPVTKPHSRNLR